MNTVKELIAEFLKENEIKKEVVRNMTGNDKIAIFRELQDICREGEWDPDKICYIFTIKNYKRKDFEIFVASAANHYKDFEDKICNFVIEVVRDRDEKVNLINLTPHALHVKLKNDETLVIPADGRVARVSTTQKEIDELNNIAIYETEYGEVVDLPEPVKNTFYIVSKITQDACRHRDDLLSPGNLIRDNEGNIVGCEGLTY